MSFKQWFINEEKGRINSPEGQYWARIASPEIQSRVGAYAASRVPGSGYLADKQRAEIAQRASPQGPTNPYQNDPYVSNYERNLRQNKLPMGIPVGKFVDSRPSVDPQARNLFNYVKDYINKSPDQNLRQVFHPKNDDPLYDRSLALRIKQLWDMGYQVKLNPATNKLQLWKKRSKV